MSVEGELVDAAGLGEGEHHRAGEELVAPVEVADLGAGDDDLQRVHQPVHDGVEEAVHGLAAPGGRVVHQG
jgi:hypothetical protein